MVAFELCMKLRWLGFHTFIRHKRTMVKVIHTQWGPSWMVKKSEVLLLCFFTDMRTDASVCGGHCGSDQADLSHASDQSSEAHFPGGLQILWCRPQVQKDSLIWSHSGACSYSHCLFWMTSGENKPTNSVQQLLCFLQSETCVRSSSHFHHLSISSYCCFSSWSYLLS